MTRDESVASAVECGRNRLERFLNGGSEHWTDRGDGIACTKEK